MIPISRPYLGEEEAAAVRETILSGWVTQGPKVKQLEEAFAAYTGAPYACAVSSCTTALHMALLAVGVKPGDVVVTASHSFIATANAVRHCCAEPVFVDIEPGTLNISPAAIERFLSEECAAENGDLYYRKAASLAHGESPLAFVRPPGGGKPGRVAALLPVHQLGVPCDIEVIVAIGRRFGLPVLEDAACAAGSELLTKAGKEKIGKPHSDVACFSFHPRKILSTGDGGMLTTANPDYDARFRLLRQHGMGVSDLARHGTTKVVFEDYLTTAYNYRLTDVQAAMGIVQLAKLPAMLKERARLAGLYAGLLKEVRWLQLPAAPSHGIVNWQSYPVIIRAGGPPQEAVMQYLLDNGVSSKRGVMNAHQEAPYRNWTSPLPNSEWARDNMMLLPLFNGLAENDVRKVASLIAAFK